MQRDEGGRRLTTQHGTHNAIVERCLDTGLYVGYVPGLPDAHSQAGTLAELDANLQEAIVLLLEESGEEASDHLEVPKRLHDGALLGVRARHGPALADAIGRTPHRQAGKLFAVGDPARLGAEAVLGLHPALDLTVRSHWKLLRR